MTMNPKVVLAFSGGLDTSFCVPYLRERGYDVYTLFADTGGVSAEERAYIEARAIELGAIEHRTVDAGPAIFEEFVRPLLWAGQWYQGQYPLLVSDRYLIVKHSLDWCDALGTKHFAHGCTGMGNDQVRFDLTVKALGDYVIHAPIREIQKEHTEVRAYEQAWLEQRGYGTRTKARAYTINENVLGVTLSGGEIDQWQIPGEGARGWCAPRAAWPADVQRHTLGFERGVPVALDGESLSGIDILKRLNASLARYGVGRGYYTGDTTIGLKGRIVFEAPGLTGLHVAHRALEEAVMTKAQNRFKPIIGARWTELVYEGFFYDPLKNDLEAYLAESQRHVSGEVVIETRGGTLDAAELRSSNILRSAKATYAQAADWGVAEAEGFIKLVGMSSSLFADVHRAK